MKLTGLHVAILIGVVVVGLVAYGTFHFNSEAPIATPPAAPEGTMAGVVEDTTGAPMIDVQPATQLDMGIVQRDAPTTKAVVVSNKGQSTLEIMSVRTSCGCTAAKIDQNKKLIPPGGQADIEVTVDPLKITGFESRKTLTINSSDPARPRIDLEVLAKIDPEFEIIPATIDFGQVRKGATPTQVMRLRQLMNEPFELSDLKLTSKDIKASFVKVPEDQWKAPGKVEYDVTVSLAEQAPLGTFSGRFALQTNCKRMHSYWCSVKAEITSFYKLIPNRPLLLRPNPKSPAPQTATVTIMGDRPYEIVSIEPSDLLTATSRPGEGPNTNVVEVALKNGPVPGQRSENVVVTLKADDEVVKENLMVRVYGTGPARPTKPVTGGVAAKGTIPAGQFQMQKPVPGQPAQQPEPQQPAAEPGMPQAPQAPVVPAAPAAPEASAAPDPQAPDPAAAPAQQ